MNNIKIDDSPAIVSLQRWLATVKEPKAVSSEKIKRFLSTVIETTEEYGKICKERGKRLLYDEVNIHFIGLTHNLKWDTEEKILRIGSTESCRVGETLLKNGEWQKKNIQKYFGALRRMIETPIQIIF